MKLTIKSVTTAIISFAIVLMLFAIFVLFFNDSQRETVTYIVDDANICEWEQGIIISSTEAFGELTTLEVDAADEEEFRQQSAQDGRCIARLGDSAGSHSAQLNEQYQDQQ